MKRKIGVLLVDDHLIVRMGLAAIISFERGMTVVGEASTGAEAVQKAVELRPDVILMDLMMPNMDGATAVERILEKSPAARILVLTTFGGSDEMARALKAGVKGALEKGVSKAELLSTLRRVAAGETVISEGIRRSVADIISISLSSRQTDILSLAAKGLNNREIGVQLGVGADCIKAHMSAIFARLGVSSRSEAIAFAVMHGLIRV